MVTEITSFQGCYRFLSNFFPALVRFEERWYTSVEHAYQAAKTLDEETRLVVCNLPTPGSAKRVGRHLKLRDGWEEMKLSVMESLVREKFKLHELRNMLVETHPAYLVEGNTWHDNFWGVCLCNETCESSDGLNHLGKILMKVREEMIV